MRSWAGPQVLVVDELGHLPMVGEAGSHLGARDCLGDEREAGRCRMAGRLVL